MVEVVVLVGVDTMEEVADIMVAVIATTTVAAMAVAEAGDGVGVGPTGAGHGIPGATIVPYMDALTTRPAM
jgi:hypothetical protein